MNEKKKAWSWSTGGYGETVRVWVADAGWIHGSVPLGSGRYKEMSLRTKDKAVARRWAKDQVKHPTAADPTPLLGRLLHGYLALHSPTKVPAGRINDVRCVVLFGTLWGPQLDLRQLGAEHWEAFIARRASGEIDAHGKVVAILTWRCPVSLSSVKADCQWLRAVIRWGTTHKDESGRYYAPRNHPALDWPLPKGPTPRRPVITSDQYRRLRAAAPLVTMERRAGGKRVPVPSYLPELLDILHGSGRRVSAVLGLTMTDLRLERTAEWPHGGIIWRAELDKERQEWRTPISREVRQALRRIIRQRGQIGSAFLFPRPDDPTRPISKELAYAWYRKAEEIAGLEHIAQGGFHQLRRLWATSRKGLPVKDVAAAGGWKQVDSLLECYTHVDADTELQVVEHKADVRRIRS